MHALSVPELLAPAGSLDAVRAAVANGANAVYLGASMYNARDEGAQLTLEEVAQACALAHARGVRIYLTFNVLIKPHELPDALFYLGECVDCGIDAAIVQDLGVVRLIQRVYPGLEVHGSTQMTVHDASGALVMERLGIERVVLARENTLDDLRAIRAAVPTIGLETFVHGALCIAYSGQCFMSGMISERSANRGSCAQSCRKDYVLSDSTTNAELDRGFLISAKDLAAHDHLEQIALAGIGCLKVEGRKKKPEYVATVTHAYRQWLDRLAGGDITPPPREEVEPLVQIFSRGNTGGMYGGRVGREYITRDQPDNRGLPIGVVVGHDGGHVLVEVSHPIAVGDGIGFEPPTPDGSPSIGGAVSAVRTVSTRDGIYRQSLAMRVRAAKGWSVVRSSDVTLLESAKASYASVALPEHIGRVRVDVRVFGSPGGPLKTIWRAGENEVTARGDVALAHASKRALNATQLREQFGRLGESTFALGAVDDSGLATGMFVPVSELNRIRQQAVELLQERLDWQRINLVQTRQAVIAQAIAAVSVQSAAPDSSLCLRAIVYDVASARSAADGGATEVVLDPFLRHPTPARARVVALHDELASRGVALRLRTPTIVRPAERAKLEKWLGLGLPILTGHLGLVAELGGAGRDVVADYATNAFNQHTASLLFELGASRVCASVELTLDEVCAMIAPWEGAGFDALVYGRPEGMTIEHCVLSAAYDRIPGSCRDLCVQQHTNVSLTDPAGYAFAVATDSDCRNRLLHSRPIDGSEYLPSLWRHGVRGFHLLFNVPGDPVQEITSAYRAALEALAGNGVPNLTESRQLLNGEFTRGHFVRAV